MGLFFFRSFFYFNFDSYLAKTRLHFICNYFENMLHKRKFNLIKGVILILFTFNVYYTEIEHDKKYILIFLDLTNSNCFCLKSSVSFTLTFKVHTLTGQLLCCRCWGQSKLVVKRGRRRLLYKFFASFSTVSNSC